MAHTKRTKKKKPTNKWILCSVAVLAGLFAAVLYLSLLFYVEITEKNTIQKLHYGITERALAVEASLDQLGRDVLLLSELSSLQVLINTADAPAQAELVENVEWDFLDFATQNTLYYQIRYIDEIGQEIVRIDHNGEVYTPISGSLLQDKRGRYYFDSTMQLYQGEVFISPLDLNIERGEVENRGSLQTPTYVPVIRYATPVFDQADNPKGIIITNVYAEHLLEKIQMSQVGTNKLFLLNAKGFYLSHPDQKKEFEFMFGEKSSFFRDYPELANHVLANDGRTFVETDDTKIMYRYIYPLFPSSDETSGFVRFENIPKENHFWVIAMEITKAGAQ